MLFLDVACEPCKYSYIVNHSVLYLDTRNYCPDSFTCQRYSISTFTSENLRLHVHYSSHPDVTNKRKVEGNTKLLMNNG